MTDSKCNRQELFRFFQSRFSGDRGFEKAILAAYLQEHFKTHTLERTMAPVTIHLRSETKNLERRSALSPDAVRILQENGFKIHVERSSLRCFSDDEFTQVGATLVPEHSWPDAPADHIIMGLKELEDRDPFPLKVILILMTTRRRHC